MRRIEIILGELERLTRGLNLAHLAQETAFTAEAIGFNLGLARNSVSKDLNQLWNDGLAIKSRGRPVFFLHRQAIETLLGRKLDESEREVQTVADLLPVQENQATDDPFSGLIGYDRSLRDAVEKGRAAVLYPHGLHVLLTGPSGVGKTFFAELMHRFACERAVGASPPLVYFNCAEYAHNPELLSSHLFGHRQGHLPAQMKINPVWSSKPTVAICCSTKCIVCRMKARKSYFLFSTKANTGRWVPAPWRGQSRFA